MPCCRRSHVFAWVLLGLIAAVIPKVSIAGSQEPGPPGSVYQDCALCPEMVWLPAGTFVMGRNGGKAAEAPAQLMRIKRPIAVARTETTFDQYKACHDDGACRSMPWDRDWGRGDRPVIYVTFEMASDYAAWLSLKTGRVYRLPTEAEWEYAAWGGDATWRTGLDVANCNGCVGDWDHKTFPVGTFDANGFGLHDMQGNVMEWTSDCWTESHAPSAPDCSKRTRKGGSWYFDRYVSTPTYRFGGRLTHTGYDIGFRVVAE